MQPSTSLRLLFAPLVLLLPLASCSTTRASSDQEVSGFLSDYERIERPEKGKAAFWADPEFNFEDYDSIQVVDVEVWEYEGLDRGEAERIASLFQSQVQERLAADGWRISNEPGSRTLSIRLALTEVEGANRFGSFVTSIPYLTTEAIRLASAASDVHVFVGKASTELQILNSETGALLAEAYDRRVGDHRLQNMGSTWGDVEDAIEVFAERIAEGLTR